MKISQKLIVQLHHLGVATLLAFSIQLHAYADDVENPSARATLDVCAELDTKRAELFKTMLAPPYSCAVNLDKHNAADKSSKEYKYAYAEIQKFTRVHPKIIEYCAVIVLHCINAAQHIPNDYPSAEEGAILKKWYPEMVK